ncbi:FAD-dependent oxidoreductase, partial [Pseudopedobacter sp.]|uniref:FAD-dependent oxidoreductase n=1 Tax=Pseudopedobacter sp. TaxID=1936787 RepID=UPI00333FC65C
LIFTQRALAQHKTDVLVVSASASGTSAAIQAARSGVKTILLNKGTQVIGNSLPKTDVPAFNLGFWKEWQDSCKTDSINKDPRLVLENRFLKKTKGLEYLNSSRILGIKEKGKNWVVEIERNGKNEDIKCKVIIDATFSADEEILNRFNLLPLKNGKIDAVTSFEATQRFNPYSSYTKLYRTSIAAGYGRSKDSVYYFPIGIFIAKTKPTILVANLAASVNQIDNEDLQNIALWTNIGQSIGALAAYGPFFNTTADKANVRMVQGEVFTFKSLIYPVTDVPEDDFAFSSVQRIIGSQILTHDFVSGRFNPEGIVNKNDIKDILSELHPRSRIWFIENPKVSDLSVKDAVSLISFIGGKEIYSIEDELKRSWKEKFKLQSDFLPDKMITRKEMAILMNQYLAPFSIRVDMQGLFIK